MNVATTLEFRCNVCGLRNEVPYAGLGREAASCAECGSTVRMRAIVHLLSMGLFGRSLAIADFPRRPDILGIGLSDWVGYAQRLPSRLGYTNTYYHQEPRLDISQVGDELAARYDFLISTDVFEHVLPPVSKAFDGAHKLLKPGGLFVLTVPFTFEADTLEHFPQLHEFALEDKPEGGRRLRNRRADGVEEVFDDLVFHGGDGSTLELRLFSKDALARELESAGFTDLRFHDEPCLEHGVWWRDPWSVPVTARAAARP